MTRAKVWVEINQGGDVLLEAVREKLRPHDVGGLPVELRPYYGKSPLSHDAPGGHDVYFHSEDGSKCIWIPERTDITAGGPLPPEDGYWFVPLDVGGEGVHCEKEHHAPSDCLHDPKSYYFGVEPALGLSSNRGDLNPDDLAAFHIGTFVETIYVAPWVTMAPPVHAAWLHQPTGATSPVCDRDAVGESVYDHVEAVTCVTCLRLLLQMRRLER